MKPDAWLIFSLSAGLLQYAVSGDLGVPRHAAGDANDGQGAGVSMRLHVRHVLHLPGPRLRGHLGSAVATNMKKKT